MNANDFTFIAGLLKSRSGLVITPDKTYLLETRLTSMMRETSQKDLSGLIDLLRQPTSEALRERVVDAMTTNETSFFRDNHPFETLRKSVLPGLIERRAASRSLRIWSAACSTGQEPYSLAMIIKDHFPILSGWRIEIVATDISPSVLERARTGLYSTFEVQRGLPIQMLVRHFDQVGNDWRIKEDLKRNIVFKSANLLEDLSHLGMFDVVLCRNVLIYFDQDTKARILRAIARNMAPDGALLLGGAESVFGICDALAGLPGLKGVYSHAKPSAVNSTTGRPLAAAS